MLDDLLTGYSYFGSPELNQWFFNKERDNPFAFLCYIFAKGKGNNLVVELHDGGFRVVGALFFDGLTYIYVHHRRLLGKPIQFFSLWHLIPHLHCNIAHVGYNHEEKQHRKYQIG